MAMPYIISHNENIYSLEEKESAKLKKPPRFNSKFQKQVKFEMKSIRDKHRTMGYAEIPLSSPKNYLKIGGGIHANRGEKDHVCVERRMPPIPKINENSRPKKSDKNFKKENIKIVTSAEPNRPLPRFVDTRNGDYHDLRKSGLMPVYIYQPKFGKLPKYLIKRIRDVAAQEQFFRDEESRKQPLCRYVTQEERMELIGGLKHNWEKLQQIYQGLPVLTDSIPKALRKTKLENDLKQLEKDILLVEDHPYIYVYNNNNDNDINNESSNDKKINYKK